MQRTHRNLAVARLVEMSLVRDETNLTNNGALLALTSLKTGRSPNDKFIVQNAMTESTVAWGKVNRPITMGNFERLRKKVEAYCEGRELFEVDAFAGADPAHRLSIRIVTEQAWHALFARQLFRRLNVEERKLPGTQATQFTVFAVPGCRADPHTDGTQSETFIAIDFESRTALIGGTLYAGEIKKVIFTVMNFFMPEQNVFPMHCSANMGMGGDVAVFFGLSGTGKTSLSADPRRQLIGDDEHGWGDKGVFNFEGGCYAKCIRLSRAREPQIWDAVRFGSVVENALMNPDTREIDFKDDSITENSRVAYPLDFIPNAIESGMGGHPSSVIFLAADAFGILPPIARLNEKQAMYHFLSGYTAKLAGTEAGIGREPEATFSTCFGEPFMPLPPRVYAKMLAEKIRMHHCRCYLINTGWVNGPYGIGSRIPLDYNRASIQEILNGNLDDAPCRVDPVFGFAVPKRCNGVPSELLQLRETWKNPSEYDAKARDLAARFTKNFERYADSVPDLICAGPRSV